MSKLAVPAAVILLLLTSCESLALLNQTANETGAPVEQADVTADPTWEKITTSKVEEVCLIEAKRAAGEHAWAVRGCLCDELVSDGMKQYYCDVSAFDPSGTDYFVKISCSLAGRTCTIQSNVGTETVTLEELEAMYD